MKVLQCALAALSLGVAALPAHAVIVQNGGFDEIGNNPVGLTLGDSDGQTLSSLIGASGRQSWDVFGSLPGGWVAPTGAGIEVQSLNTLNPKVTPHSGTFYVELDTETEGGSNSNSVMEQALGILAPRRYELSFFYRPRTGQVNTNGITVEIFDGVLLAQNIVSTNTSDWVEQVIGFNVGAGAGDLTLRFSAGGLADEIGGLIDTVSINAVPVPAALPLLLTGIGALGFAARRRRKAA